MVNIKKTRDSNGGIIHHGVSAVIRRNGKYLLIDRAIKPFGYGCISGHMYEEEEAVDALVREVREEAGLKVISQELIFKGKLKSRGCSYGKIPHYCYIFECEVEGEPNRNPREVKSIGWYSEDEIKNLKLEPLWRFYFRKMKII